MVIHMLVKVVHMLVKVIHMLVMAIQMLVMLKIIMQVAMVGKVIKHYMAMFTVDNFLL